MIKRIIILSLFMAASFAASADTIGFVVGAGSWSQDASGDLTSGSVTNSQPFTKGDSASMVWAVIEHPIPVLPNVRFATTPVDSSNDSGDSLKMDQTDLTLYYEILDNWVNLDLGLTGRKIDGTIKTSGSSDDFNATIPMVYARAQFDVPITGLSIGALVNTIGVFKDVSFYVSYETAIGLGLELGQRKQTIDLDDNNDVTSSLENSGTYFAAFYHF